MLKYNNLLNFYKVNTPVFKDLEKLKYIQAEISKREKIIEDMNILYLNKIKYDKEYYDYAEVITSIITGRADISLMEKMVKIFNMMKLNI